MIRCKKATLVECQTVLSSADVHRLLEIAAVEEHNQRAIDEWLKAKEK